MNTKGVAIRYGDIAPEAKENFKPSSDSAKFDTLAQLQQYNLNFPNYANPCELYSVVLDGTATAFPSVPENAKLGLWSEQISNDDGTFTEPLVLELKSVGQYSSQGLTLTFDTYNGIFATRLSIKWLRITDEGITTLDEKEYTPDNAFYFCRNFVENYNKVVITFYSLNMPKNRLKLRVIDYGYGTFFYGDELRGIKLIQEIDPISTQISINTADFTLDSKTNMEYSFQAKQPLLVYFNGKLKATTFVKKSTRKAKRLWSIQSEDYIGLLDSIPYYGGLYTDKNAVELLTDIFTVAKVPYTIDDVFLDATVTGYIPFTTCRDALMQVAFAIQAVVDTSNSEVVNVFALPRNLISNEILGEQAKAISENTVSNIGYVCPVGNEIIFGHTKEIGLEKGKDYTISFKAWSNNNYSVCWDLWTLPNIGDENLLPQKWFDVTSIPTLYEWTFNVNENFMPNASLRFLNVMQDGTINNITSPIYVTDIQIEEGNNRSNWSVSGRAKHIPLNRIMQGQNFADEETVTGVEVAVHSYKPITETIDVYDANESGTGQNIFVKFSEPLHDLSITNGEIVSRETNYAVINANAGCILRGQQYEHTTQTRRKNNPVVLAGEIEKVVAIENATLVSQYNIDKVLEKCYNWLIKTNTTNLKIVEGKHIQYGSIIKYGQKKYGTFKYGEKNPNIVTYDEIVNIGDTIKCETEYLGVVKGIAIKQSFTLNGNIIIKDTTMR